MTVLVAWAHACFFTVWRSKRCRIKSEAFKYHRVDINYKTAWPRRKRLGIGKSKHRVFARQRTINTGVYSWLLDTHVIVRASGSLTFTVKAPLNKYSKFDETPTPTRSRFVNYSRLQTHDHRIKRRFLVAFYCFMFIWRKQLIFKAQ